MSAIGLRRAILADAPAIGALHVASWRETYTGLVPDAMLTGLTFEARTAMWSAVLADPDAFGRAALFVAEEDGRAVGFGACGDQRDNALADAGFGGEIGAVYVLRSHQQRGAGRALIGALFRALSDRGHAAASLWVLRENTAARAFYEGLGGEIVAERTEAALTEIAYGWRNLASPVTPGR